MGSSFRSLDAFFTFRALFGVVARFLARRYMWEKDGFGDLLMMALPHHVDTMEGTNGEDAAFLMRDSYQSIKVKGEQQSVCAYSLECLAWRVRVIIRMNLRERFRLCSKQPAPSVALIRQAFIRIYRIGPRQALSGSVPLCSNLLRQCLADFRFPVPVSPSTLGVPRQSSSPLAPRNSDPHKNKTGLCRIKRKKTS